MAEQLSPGIQFTEPRLAPAEIVSASTSIGGMTIVAERGPINRPVLCGSSEEAQKVFGVKISGSYGPGSWKAFFDNGGRSLYINRAGHYTDITDASTLDAVKAALQLSGDGPVDTLKLRASSEGAHGNALTVTTLRVDTTVGAVATNIGAGATTTATLSDVRRLYVGAQVLLKNGSNKLRVIITRMDTSTKKIYFVSSTPSGAITASGSSVVLEEWNLSISRSGTFLESIKGLAMSTTAGDRYFKDVINNGDPVRQVEVQTDSLLALSNTVDPRPIDITNEGLGGTTAGTDGTAPNDTDVVGSATSGTGFYAFDNIDDVNILTAPGYPTTTVQNGMITYLEGRNPTSLFGIMSVNVGQTPTQAKTYVQTTANLYTEYAAIYYPWVKVVDADTGLMVSFPPDGFILGMYARTDANRNVAKAPAGTPDGRLLGALGVERKLDASDLDLLYPVNINAIISKPGKGVIVWGSRTLSTGEFRQINVRRVFNFVKQSLKNGTDWVVFEPNDDNTRGKVRKSVGAFLLRLWRKGILKGDVASDAFLITCDRTNNPPSVEQAGQLICRVSLAISRPAEFVTFELVQDTRALDAELAAAGIA